MAPKKISFGVLFLPSYQALDAVGPIDLITIGSSTFAGQFGSDEIRSLAPEITWHYISSSYPSVMKASSGPGTVPTTSLADCPKLDYLLLPGAPPETTHLTKEEIEFLVQKADEVDALLTVCTGSLILSQTGLLKGVKACTNKGSLGSLAAKGKVPKEVIWMRDRRWVVDGKYWSSSGITAGMDLAVQWIRRVVGEEMWQWVTETAEYSPIEMGGDKFAYMLTDVKLT
ncbi:ThiJ/PfpI [Wilcoxina mikolae CBS 423.85]|nr:ThiJ/PfpI [Wilcoxina mikolae CBS 423.85]